MVILKSKDGKLVACLSPNDLSKYGIANRHAVIEYLPNGMLYDYPDWLESYPNVVDKIIDDAEHALRQKYYRCFGGNNGVHHRV